ncbi:uncharacterized protein LOC142318038 isoform X2 [Lycorma delicatula]
MKCVKVDIILNDEDDNDFKYEFLCSNITKDNNLFNNFEKQNLSIQYNYLTKFKIKLLYHKTSQRIKFWTSSFLNKFGYTLYTFRDSIFNFNFTNKEDNSKIVDFYNTSSSSEQFYVSSAKAVKVSSIGYLSTTDSSPELEIKKNYDETNTSPFDEYSNLNNINHSSKNFSVPTYFRFVHTTLKTISTTLITSNFYCRDRKNKNLTDIKRIKINCIISTINQIMKELIEHRDEVILRKFIELCTLQNATIHGKSSSSTRVTQTLKGITNNLSQNIEQSEKSFSGIFSYKNDSQEMLNNSFNQNSISKVFSSEKIDQLDVNSDFDQNLKKMNESFLKTAHSNEIENNNKQIQVTVARVNKNPSVISTVLYKKSIVDNYNDIIISSIRSKSVKKFKPYHTTLSGAKLQDQVTQRTASNITRSLVQSLIPQITLSTDITSSTAHIRTTTAFTTHFLNRTISSKNLTEINIIDHTTRLNKNMSTFIAKFNHTLRIHMKVTQFNSTVIKKSKMTLNNNSTHVSASHYENNFRHSYIDNNYWNKSEESRKNHLNNTHKINRIRKLLLTSFTRSERILKKFKKHKNKVLHVNYTEDNKKFLTKMLSKNNYHLINLNFFKINATKLKNKSYKIKNTKKKSYRSSKIVFPSTILNFVDTQKKNSSLKVKMFNITKHIKLNFTRKIVVHNISTTLLKKAKMSNRHDEKIVMMRHKLRNVCCNVSDSLLMKIINNTDSRNRVYCALHNLTNT